MFRLRKLNKECTTIRTQSGGEKHVRLVGLTAAFARRETGGGGGGGGGGGVWGAGESKF